MSILKLEKEIHQDRTNLIEHKLFSNVDSIDKLKIFMQSHVFAVWDFMSLLKTLQKQITHVETPWLPPKNNLAARLINEIVVGEESDEVEPGQYMSHFELYLRSMSDCGAETRQIKQFVDLLYEGHPVEFSLSRVEAKDHVKKFVLSTLSFCNLKPHLVAAAFLFGREDIIPDMFRRILLDVDVIDHPHFAKLKFYLERHIAIDSDSHGPLAKLMMELLCGDDQAKWDEAIVVAKNAINARILFWDGCYQVIKTL